MNKHKSIMVMAFAVLTLSIGLTPAFATHIEGEVRDGSSTNTDAWITSESDGKYRLVLQPSSGDYNIGTNNYYSTVSASKYGDEREVQTSVVRNSNDVDFDIGSRSKVHMRYVLATESTIPESTMRSHIQAAEDYFQEEHNINFLESSSPTWTPGTITDCSDLATEVASDVDWSNISGDILIAFVDINNMTEDGDNVLACTVGPYGSGQRPVIVIANDTPDFPRSIMHEISHDYGMTHESSCSNIVPNIMAVTCGSDYIMNWNPTRDSDLESNRSWY